LSDRAVTNSTCLIALERIDRLDQTGFHMSEGLRDEALRLAAED